MKIMEDRSDIAVEVLPPGSTITPSGFNHERVCTIVNEDSLIQQTPSSASCIGLKSTHSHTMCNSGRMLVFLMIRPSNEI